MVLLFFYNYKKSLLFVMYTYFIIIYIFMLHSHTCTCIGTLIDQLLKLKRRKRDIYTSSYIFLKKTYKYR